MTYQYDALIRRVHRDDDTNETVRVQNGQQAFAVYDSGTAAGSPDYNYAYASYIDEPVLRIASGDDHYYHGHQQFSVIAITNQSGSIKERFSYTAYGQLGIYDGGGTSRSASNYDIRHTYTGREWDEVAELYCFRERIYLPRVGRFGSRDPIGYVDGMNRYASYMVTDGLDPQGTEVINSPFPPVGQTCRMSISGKLTCRPSGSPHAGPDPKWVRLMNLVCNCGTSVVKIKDFSETAAVMCKNGLMDVYYPIRPLTNQGRQLRQIRDRCGISSCIYDHEVTHIMYFTAVCGAEVCKEKQCESDEVTLVGLRGAAICHRLHECLATTGSIECAVRKLKIAQQNGNVECEEAAKLFLLQEANNYVITYDCRGIAGGPQISPDAMAVIRRLLSYPPPVN